MALTQGSYIQAVDFNTVKNKLIDFRTMAGQEPATPTSLAQVAVVGVPIKAQDIIILGNEIESAAMIPSGCSSHYVTNKQGLCTADKSSQYSTYNTSVNSGDYANHNASNESSNLSGNGIESSTGHTVSDCSSRTCNPFTYINGEEGYNYAYVFNYEGTVKPSSASESTGTCIAMNTTVCSAQRTSQNSTWYVSYNSTQYSGQHASWNSANRDSDYGGYKTGHLYGACSSRDSYVSPY